MIWWIEKISKSSSHFEPISTGNVWNRHTICYIICILSDEKLESGSFKVVSGFYNHIFVCGSYLEISCNSRFSIEVGDIQSQLAIFLKFQKNREWKSRLRKSKVEKQPKWTVIHRQSESRRSIGRMINRVVKKMTFLSLKSCLLRIIALKSWKSLK